MGPDRRVPYLPARIEGLADVAMNLSWSWNREARALFREIDQLLWHETHHNPLELLRRADPAHLAARAALIATRRSRANRWTHCRCHR